MRLLPGRTSRHSVYVLLVQYREQWPRLGEVMKQFRSVVKPFRAEAVLGRFGVQPAP
jgi:hypothetical protein